MKTKRFVAMPGLMALFVLLLCVVVVGLTVFLVDALSSPTTDVLITVFLAFLLVCMGVSIAVIGYTIGAFDVVCIYAEYMVICRLGKKLRQYSFSQNTQLRVQYGYKGARHIEIAFPEYFVATDKNIKAIQLREGYVCLDFSKSRLAYVEKVIQHYKSNIAPIEQPQW